MIIKVNECNNLIDVRTIKAKNKKFVNTAFRMIKEKSKMLEILKDL